MNILVDLCAKHVDTMNSKININGMGICKKWDLARFSNNKRASTQKREPYQSANAACGKVHELRGKENYRPYPPLRISVRIPFRKVRK